MLRLAIAFSFATLAASIASAETRVRAGEHATFSRLVLYFDALPDWRLGRVPGGYELRTGDADIRFDTSAVFGRVPRERIATLAPGSEPGSLRIGVECDCSIDAFRFRESALVIDVREAPADPGSPFEVALDPEVAVPPLAPRRVIWPALIEPEPLPLIPGVLTAPRVPPPAVAAARARLQAPAAPEDFTMSPAALDARLAGTAEEMLHELGRAAAQGLVEPNLEKTRAAIEEANQRSSRHVAITTSVDRALAWRRPEPALSAEGSACIAPERLDIAAWGAAETEGAGLAEFREHLLAEFDQSVPETVLALARHYIYLSFGAEAGALLHTFPLDEDEVRLLGVMAEIVDNGQAADPGPLTGQFACDGPAALWAALAVPSLPRGETVDADAVTREFARLPIHLRRHLGPGLAERFLAAGDENTATALRNAMTRAPGAPGDAVELLEVRLDSAKGKPAAEATLSRLSAATSQAGIEASILLLEQQTEAGRVDPMLVESVAALAFEQAGNPVAARLKAAEIAARIALDRFDEALAALDRAAGNPLDPATVATLRAKAYVAMAERLEPGAFLPIAFAADAALETEGPEREARRAVASRLLELRFPAEARTLVGRPDMLPEPADRLILAEAAFQRGEREIAESYLVGLDGGSVAELRTTYAPEPMSAALAPLPDAAEAAEATEHGVLARGRTALEASEALRARISAVLDNPAGG